MNPVPTDPLGRLANGCADFDRYLTRIVGVDLAATDPENAMDVTNTVNRTINLFFLFIIPRFLVIKR